MAPSHMISVLVQYIVIAARKRFIFSEKKENMSS